MGDGGSCHDDAKRSEDAVRRLAGALAEGVACVREGRIAWCNDALAAMAAQPGPAELGGAALAELAVDLGDGLPEALRPGPLECGLRDRRGRVRRLRWHLAWPSLAGGADVWVIEDPTRERELGEEVLRVSQELARLHRELASLRDRLHHEHAERDEILAVVSHELRTPVTVIGGYARILLREEVGPLSPEQRRFVEESVRACRKLDGFIDRLLTAAQVAKGGEVLEVCTGLLTPLVGEVVERIAPLFEQRGSRLALAAAPECRARFDAMRIEQVLVNLLDNALKYAKPGSAVEVSVRPVAVEGRRMVEVAVRDEGPGVPPDDRERISQPYARGRGAPPGGLGLGLALCRRIVEGHGGRMALEEAAGGGSRFAFTLPDAEA
jgi:signal transduction histidine kinase